MEDMDGIMRQLERPPSKNNLTVYSIIQIILMLCIGCSSGKDLFDIFSYSKFSIIDLIKIVVDGLIFIGFLLAAYAFFVDNSDHLKKGFLLFFFGLIGWLIICILDWFRSGFGFGSLIEFLIYCFLTYIIYIQCPHI